MKYSRHVVSFVRTVLEQRIRIVKPVSLLVNFTSTTPRQDAETFLASHGLRVKNWIGEAPPPGKQTTTIPDSVSERNPLKGITISFEPNNLAVVDVPESEKDEWIARLNESSLVQEATENTLLQ